MSRSRCCPHCRESLDELPDVDLNLDELVSAAEEAAQANEDREQARQAKHQREFVEYTARKTRQFAKAWLSKVVAAIKKASKDGKRKFRVTCNRGNIHEMNGDAEANRAACEAAAKQVTAKLPDGVQCEQTWDRIDCGRDESHGHYVIFIGRF